MKAATLDSFDSSLSGFPRAWPQAFATPLNFSSSLSNWSNLHSPDLPLAFAHTASFRNAFLLCNHILPSQSPACSLQSSSSVKLSLSLQLLCYKLLEQGFSTRDDFAPQGTFLVVTSGEREVVTSI